MSVLLIHGAWTGGWVWESVMAELRSHGRVAGACDLPSDDVNAGVDEYAEVIVAAARVLESDGRGLTLVGHSLAGVVMPLLAERVDVARFIYVCGMAPVPGQSLADSLSNGMKPGAASERGRRFDRLARSYWHDKSEFDELMLNAAPIADTGWIFDRLRTQSRKLIREPSSVTSIPDVAADYIAYAADRIFYEDWQRRQADQLEAEFHVLPGSHFEFATNPGATADLIIGLTADD